MPLVTPPFRPSGPRIGDLALANPVILAPMSGVTDAPFRRLLARAWNKNVTAIAGWPTRTLMEPPVKAAVVVAWQNFPDGLRQDLERYLESLTRVRRSRTGQRIRPLKPSTIRTRRAEFQAAARMAVETGVPIDTLTSLAALLAPGDAAERHGTKYPCKSSVQHQQ